MYSHLYVLSSLLSSLRKIPLNLFVKSLCKISLRWTLANQERGAPKDPMELFEKAPKEVRDALQALDGKAMEEQFKQESSKVRKKIMKLHDAFADGLIGEDGEIIKGTEGNKTVTGILRSNGFAEGGRRDGLEFVWGGCCRSGT